MGLAIVALGLNCRQTGGGNVTSETYFTAAEKGLAEGRYEMAAAQLNQGIVVYRMETGKMSGIYAVRANHAIDGLIRIRKSLRHGDTVPTEALHDAIIVAMESGSRPQPSTPKTDPSLIQTVGGR